MIFLMLTILAYVAIFMAFRGFSKFKVNTLAAIVTNYLVCVITGSLYTGPSYVVNQLDPNTAWFHFSAFLGLVFIGVFFLMAHVTQQRGVAVATVASKMSLAIPVIFSLFVFKIATNELDALNYAGIVLAFLAIWLVSKPKSSESTSTLNWKALGLPLVLFFMGGLVDASLNYANHRWITADIEPVFPIMTFGSAFLLGLTFCLIKKIPFRSKDILAGILLGIPNYFSIYLQLKALSAFNNNGAVLYPSLNIGIIIGSTLAAVLIFREKLSHFNQVGVALAVIVIFLLSHQGILRSL